MDAVPQADLGGPNGPTRRAPAPKGRASIELTTTPETATDQQVLITRIFEAPREAVFRAWTDPDEVAVWYGPEQMEAPSGRGQHRPARRVAAGN